MTAFSPSQKEETIYEVYIGGSIKAIQTRFCESEALRRDVSAVEEMDTITSFLASREIKQ